MDGNEDQGLGKMTGNPVVSFDRAKGWNLFLAVFHTDRAARMETTARRRIDGAWNVTREDDPILFPFGVGYRRCC